MSHSPEDTALIAAARSVIRRRTTGKCEMGQVGAAIRTPEGALHLGVCIDAPCGIGFCAEHAAIAAMVTAGESRIAAAVAVAEDGRILPPCGRCREFIALLDPANAQARVVMPEGAVALADLLPAPWANA